MNYYKKHYKKANLHVNLDGLNTIDSACKICRELKNEELNSYSEDIIKDEELNKCFEENKDNEYEKNRRKTYRKSLLKNMK